jgi:hypothetical protein
LDGGSLARRVGIDFEEISKIKNESARNQAYNDFREKCEAVIRGHSEVNDVKDKKSSRTEIEKKVFRFFGFGAKKTDKSFVFDGPDGRLRAHGK